MSSSDSTSTSVDSRLRGHDGRSGDWLPAFAEMAEGANPLTPTLSPWERESDKGTTA